MTIQEIIIAAYRTENQGKGEELIVRDYIYQRWRSQWERDTTDPASAYSPTTAEAAGMLGVDAAALATIYSDAPNQPPDGEMRYDAETWVDPTVIVPPEVLED